MISKQQMRAILKAIENSRSVTLPGTAWDMVDGKFVVTELMNPTERSRLFASEDFKLGWAMAHKELSDTLTWILSANNEDLVRYAGKPKK